MSIQDEIEKVRADAEKSHAEAERLKSLAIQYPDLRKYVGRWNKIVFCSKAVNSIVNRFDLRHSCGCCSDSSLQAWPYVETGNGKVYSDPPMFSIGRKAYGHGDVEEPGWDADMRKHGIPETVLDQIRPRFRGRDDDSDGDD